MATSESEIKHWPRWVTASLAKYFSSLPRGTMAFRFEFELNKDEDIEQISLMNVNIEGPVFQNPSKGYWIIRVTPSILVQTLVKDNMYAHSVDVGLVTDMFDGCIPLYKYGDGADDDSSQFGTLVRGRDTSGIIITKFGRLDEDVPLAFSRVEGDYYAQFQF